MRLEEGVPIAVGVPATGSPFVFARNSSTRADAMPAQEVGGTGGAEFAYQPSAATLYKTLKLIATQLPSVRWPMIFRGCEQLLSASAYHLSVGPPGAGPGLCITA